MSAAMRLPRDTLRRAILEAMAAAGEPISTSAVAEQLPQRPPQHVRSAMNSLWRAGLIAAAGQREIPIRVGGGLRGIYTRLQMRPLYAITGAGRDWLDGGAALSPGRAPAARHDHSALAKVWR